MKTTISKVVRTDDTLNEFMQKWCDQAASKGGTFEIKNAYEPGSCWFTIYTINWPEGMKVEA